MKIDVLVYLLLIEKFCVILYSSSRIGVQIFIVVYDGIRLIQKVFIDMIMIVIVRIFC